MDQIAVELCSHWGADRDAAHAAWASSTDRKSLDKKSDKDVRRLVSGLVALGHDTPKERVWMEFFITCPIFVERQYDKYRLTVQYQDIQVESQVGAFGRHGITQNELSGRYRTIPERHYKTPKDVAAILGKALAIKPDEIQRYAEYASVRWDTMLRQQHDSYKEMLGDLKEAQAQGNISNDEYKRAREVLRGLLGTSYLTDMRIVLNVNALEHIINQRLAKDAQLESRMVAALMLGAVIEAEVAPVLIFEMAVNNGWFELIEDLESKL